LIVPNEYSSERILVIPSVPMRHAIITIGMADLGWLLTSVEQAGERRLRRKRSPRWRLGVTSTRNLLWTRATGAGLQAYTGISILFQSKSSNLPNDFVKIGAP
jgi:hypothetical protein